VIAGFADKFERISNVLNNLLFANNEKGSAIVVALMVLMVLTIVGISSTNTTIVELQTVRNEGIYKQNLYLAEAAAQEAIQRLYNQAQTDPAELKNKTPVWLNDDTVDFANANNWDSDATGGDDNSLVAALDPDTVLTIVDRGISPGASLDISGATNTHDFAVYGLSNHNSGMVLIQIGYRYRF